MELITFDIKLSNLYQQDAYAGLYVSDGRDETSIKIKNANEAIKALTQIGSISDRKIIISKNLDPKVDGFNGPKLQERLNIVTLERNGKDLTIIFFDLPKNIVTESISIILKTQVNFDIESVEFDY